MLLKYNALLFVGHRLYHIVEESQNSKRNSRQSQPPSFPVYNLIIKAQHKITDVSSLVVSDIPIYCRDHHATNQPTNRPSTIVPSIVIPPTQFPAVPHTGEISNSLHRMNENVCPATPIRPNEHSMTSVGKLWLTMAMNLRRSVLIWQDSRLLSYAKTSRSVILDNVR